MDEMTDTLEAIHSLPDEYKLKINKHCIGGDSTSLDKALNAALSCSQKLDGLDRMNTDQKRLAKTLLTIRKGLASELLRLEGFDLKAAKDRGKAETVQSEVKSKKKWNKAVVPST